MHAESMRTIGEYTLNWKNISEIYPITLLPANPP